jgi:membrane protease YdiL (CAAX protease family)
MAQDKSITKYTSLRNSIINRHQQIGWLALILLLLLRIPYTIAIIAFLPIENQNGSAVYEVSTYFLTCFLLWWERKRLEEFHIDAAVLILIIFARPLQIFILRYWGVDSPLAFPQPSGLALLAISSGLIVVLWRSGIKLSRFASHSFLWLVMGLAVGIFLSIAENFQTVRSMLSNGYSSQMQLIPILSSSSLNLLYHLGFAPINEEPLFRGFLWGYLRQLGWKEIWILLFQSVLFASAHIYIARQFPLMFWIFIPSAALLFGFLTWRSRSVAPAIFAHAVVNGSVYFLIVVLVLRALS